MVLRTKFYVAMLATAINEVHSMHNKAINTGLVFLLAVFFSLLNMEWLFEEIPAPKTPPVKSPKPGQPDNLLAYAHFRDSCR